MIESTELSATKKILIIHCKLSPYAGGELLALWTCKILQEMGYAVSILSDVFEPSRAEEIYGMGDVLARCLHIQLPEPQRRSLLHFEVLSRWLYVFKLASFAKSLGKMDFDLVLSTQSSIFSFPGKKLYHFVYGIEDVFRYPIPLIVKPAMTMGSLKKWYLYLLRSLYKLLAPRPLPTWFFADGLNLLQQLQGLGYRNSSFFYPPSRVFKPRLPKKKQIIQVSRIVPEKRIEMLFDVARKLPQYKFILVVKDLSAQRRLNPGYYDRLFSTRPRELSYFETPIIQNPGLLEESKVYFHTSQEWGILLTLVEAMSAGCIPVVPTVGSGAELVKLAGIGYQYDGVDDAVRKLKLAMEEDAKWTASEISARARQFGPEEFEKLIKKLTSKREAGPWQA